MRRTSTQTAPARAIAYLRVSTEGQADSGLSLDAQRAKVTAYASLYGLTLVDVVVDAGVSAKSLDRPGLRQVLENLTAGKADALLVTKLDRLTRSVRDLGTLVDAYFAEGRFALLSVADNIDTRSAGGRLVLNVLGSVAQWEREAIAERTSEALEQLKAEGVRLGGEGLGWVRTEETDGDGHRVVREVPEEVETVQRIAGLRAEGKTLRDIAEALKAEGRRTKRGGEWHPEAVRRVLARLGAA